MRIPLTIGLLAAVAACTAAQEREPKVDRPAVDLEFDVPGDSGAQIVKLVTRDIPAGGEIPWHTHPGIETAYVENGVVEIRKAEEEPLRVGPGETFTVPRGLVHAGANVGEGTARLVITYVVDKGAPLRKPAEAPGGKP